MRVSHRSGLFGNIHYLFEVEATIHFEIYPCFCSGGQQHSIYLQNPACEILGPYQCGYSALVAEPACCSGIWWLEAESPSELGAWRALLEEHPCILCFLERRDPWDFDSLCIHHVRNYGPGAFHWTGVISRICIPPSMALDSQFWARWDRPHWVHETTGISCRYLACRVLEPIST